MPAGVRISPANKLVAPFSALPGADVMLRIESPPYGVVITTNSVRGWSAKQEVMVVNPHGRRDAAVAKGLAIRRNRLVATTALHKA